MKLIVGLGNPGADHQNNRHNLGYIVVDNFAKRQAFFWQKSQDWICYFVKREDFVLVKPISYMNKSGQSVRQVSNFYKVQGKDILVVHDDLDLDFGKMRLTFSGSGAGHKGIESLMESLGYEDFCRLRVGIGRPDKKIPAFSSKQEIEKYVLEDFSDEQKANLDQVLARCSGAIQSYLDDGIEAAMNKFN